MVGIRSSPWSQLPSSPDCDLCCMQQLCSAPVQGQGEEKGNAEGGVGLPGARITIVSSPAAYHPVPLLLLPHNAPCSGTNYSYCSVCMHPLCQKHKNEINNPPHALWKKPGAERVNATRFDIEPHTSVFLNHPLGGPRQHFPLGCVRNIESISLIFKSAWPHN